MKIYKLVIEELKQRSMAIVMVLFLILLTKLLMISLPFFMKALLDALIYEPTWATGLNIYPPMIVVAYVSIFFSASFFDEIKEYFSEKTIQPSIAGVAKKLFIGMHSLPISFYLDAKTGSTLRDFDRGIRSLQSLSSLILYTAIPLAVEIIAVIWIFFINYNIQFGLIITIGIILHATATLYLTPNLVSARRSLNALDSELNGFMGESILNFESIRLFSSAKTELLKLNKIYDLYLGGVINFQFLHSKLKIIQRAIIAITLCSLLWVAAIDVMSADITPGDFVLINAFAMQVLLPISAMGIMWKEFNQNLADVRSLDAISEYVDLKSGLEIKLKELNAPPKIEFLNVSYAYPNGKEAISNISFTLLPGSRTAIVGPNGSGKTTILRLLLGLIEPTSGEIQINGESLTPKELTSITAAFGVVPQFISLFHGSVAENLTYGSKDHSIEKAQQLASLVGLDNHILNNFPDGFNTQVGERGQKLSGGERQKIGLARALSNSPKVLILDEASSSLDENSDKLFSDLTAKMARQQTTLMITHNPDSLDESWRILSINNGVLVC